MEIIVIRERTVREFRDGDHMKSHDYKDEFIWPDKQYYRGVRIIHHRHLMVFFCPRFAVSIQCNIKYNVEIMRQTALSSCDRVDRFQ